MIDTAAPCKGFIQWANESKSALYFHNGKDVFRANLPINLSEHGFPQNARWESEIWHWNHYATAFNRTPIKP